MELEIDERACGRIAVVIPCYNAGPRLRAVLDRILSDKAPFKPDLVVVVDDGSSDGGASDDMLSQFAIEVIRFPRNRGKGAALLAGFRRVLQERDIEAAVVLDADGQHNSGEMPRMVRAFYAECADLVIGERRFTGRIVPWASWLGNTLTRRLTRLLLRRDLPDTQSGFRLHSRRLLEDVVAHIPPGRYETEMAILVRAVKSGRTVVSVPVETIYEQGNASSHFKKVSDSARVWKTLIGAVLQSSRTP